MRLRCSGNISHGSGGVLRHAQVVSLGKSRVNDTLFLSFLNSLVGRGIKDVVLARYSEQQNYTLYSVIKSCFILYYLEAGIFYLRNDAVQS